MLPTTHETVKISHKPTRPINQKQNMPLYTYKSTEARSNKNGHTEGNDIENMRTNDGNGDENTTDDENKSMSSSNTRRNLGPKKPILRRVWSYLKHAWVGVMRGSSGRNICQQIAYIKKQKISSIMSIYFQKYDLT